MIYSFKQRALRAFHRLSGLLAALFLAQLQVVEHPAKRKAVLTPRRAGKTVMACIWLLYEARRNPGKKLLYVALTRPNAKDIAWGIFKALDKRYGLGCHFQSSDLEITLPNGAKILLRGADQDNWIKRLEGQEFILIVVDESGTYDISIRNLIYDSLSPMVDSCDGTIVMIGRPGIVKMGLFWDVTRPDKRGGPKREDGSWAVLDKKGGQAWAVFNWSTFDNPYIADRWKAIIAKKLEENPDIVHDPGFRRNYLGEWADGGEGLVYAFSDAPYPAGNIIEEWKPNREWTYGYGFATDFGFGDAQGFMVGCWSEKMPELVILESYKQKGMLLTGPGSAIERMEKYDARYPGLWMWGDPARRQLYEQMAARFGARVAPAQKEEKNDNIELMNTDWALKKILVVRKTNLQFIDEILALKKLYQEQIADAALGEERPGKWKEHPRLANDLCDCALYLWRNSMHYRYSPPETRPDPGTPEAYDLEAAEHWANEARKLAEHQKQEWWRRT